MHSHQKEKRKKQQVLHLTSNLNIEKQPRKMIIIIYTSLTLNIKHTFCNQLLSVFFFLIINKDFIKRNSDYKTLQRGRQHPTKREEKVTYVTAKYPTKRVAKHNNNNITTTETISTRTTTTHTNSTTTETRINT